MARQSSTALVSRCGGGSGSGLPLLLLGAAAITGLFYGLDQMGKRKREAARFHQELAELRTLLSQKIAALADLEARLGPKNEQVRKLAAEVIRLRTLLALPQAG